MHVRTLSMAIGLLAVIAGACKGPVVPSPLTGQTRYLCCNVRYERPEITDNFYQVGTLIPFGTPVNILEVRAQREVPGVGPPSDHGGREVRQQDAPLR
jgi:hypothetical protein